MAEPVTTTTKKLGVAKNETKTRAIEITLPVSVTQEFNKWTGENPVRQKLAPEMLTEIRKRCADAALAAVTGQFDAIFKSIVGA